MSFEELKLDDYDDRTEDEIFPTVDPLNRATGSRIIVQLRVQREKTKGGIVLVQETKGFESYDDVIARVVQLGPLAYRDVNTLEHVPEGPWCKPGDIVRIAKFGGDRWRVRDPKSGEFVQMILLRDTDVLSVIDNFEATKKFYPLEK